MNYTNAIKHEPLLVPAAVRVRRLHPSAVPPSEAQDGISAVQVFTLVSWLGLVTIGGLGFTLPYARPTRPAPELSPVQAQFLSVQLSSEELPNLTPATSQTQSSEAASAIPQAPTAPALLVAEPSTVIAFAIPVFAPAQVTSAAQASYTRPKEDSSNSALPPAQTLTFGRGEGKQPAPEYPLLARREGQEGSVRVRFAVGADGCVLRAEPAESCPWPMLNDSAVRTVMKRWRFNPGPVRLYEVLIRFQLSH